MKSFIYNYDVYIISILVIIVTLFSTYKNSKFIGITNRIFALLGLVILITLISELLGWIVDKTQISFGIQLNYIVNIVIYTITPFNTLLLTVYLHSIIFTYSKYSKKWLIFFLPIVLNSILTILNQYTKFYFYIDSNNEYHRGPIFYAMIAISYTYITYFIVYLLSSRTKIKRNDLISLVFLLVFPIIGSILQSLNYGIGFTWPMFSITYLGIHLIIQQSIISRDYLTGIKNRGSIDNKINELIYTAKTKNIEFLGFMFDLDNFKTVNDVYGHDEGDELLKEFSKILINTFRRTECVGRLGGDEFMVLLENSELINIENIENRLHKNIEEYNRKNEKPWKIEVSYGKLKYPKHCVMDKKMYYSSIDKLLYLDKKKRKNTKIQSNRTTAST